MTFPDFLFRLDARDEDTGVLSVFAADGLAQGTGQQQDVDIGPIPNDRILIVTTAAEFAIPDAGLTVTAIQFYSLDPGGNATAWFHTHHNPILAAGSSWSSAWSGYHIIMPGNSIRMRAQFDAVGVGNHAAQAWLSGIMIPRGNMLEY